jgi:hypothetical protein
LADRGKELPTLDSATNKWPILTVDMVGELWEGESVVASLGKQYCITSDRTEKIRFETEMVLLRRKFLR